MKESKHILVTEGLSKYFGGLCALNKIDIAVERGQIHGLIGPNGSGKTTLFNVITGLLPATSGKCYFESIDITNINPYIISRMGISRTFQAGLLVPGMTVLENVVSGAYSGEGVGINFRSLSKASSEKARIRLRALEWLDLLDLSKLSDCWSEELVWVERQLAQIARAIMSKPKLLLMDEPTGGMGHKETKRVKKIINQLREKTETTIILVSHDVGLVTSVSDWITAINFGEKMTEGIPSIVRNNPKVVEAYLGTD